MNIDFEPVMDALFAHLSAAARLDFTADIEGGSTVLTNVSSVAGLFAGLPVFGPGIPAGTVIAAIDAEDSAITLSAPAEDDAADADLFTGFLTTGRRLLHWQQVTAQPALFLRRTGTTDAYDAENFYSITTLECEIWIYSQAGADPDAVPDVTLSNLDRMVRQSFVPDTDDGDPRFTLNRLVHWCRIEGRSDYSPGDQMQQGISRIPVRITLP